MTTVNVHEAKTHLSRLLKRVVAGETVIIAKAGRPIARLVSIEMDGEPHRLGFLSGQGRVPEDFDLLDGQQIQAMFESE